MEEIREFADQLNEIMPIMMREFIRREAGSFCKMRITMPQYLILDTLYRHGEHKMTELSTMLTVTTAAITGVVDRLVRDGYARRISDPGDRRVVKIGIKPKGERAVREILEKRRSVIMSVFSKITKENRQQYLNILKKIKNNLDLSHKS